MYLISESYRCEDEDSVSNVPMKAIRSSMMLASACYLNSTPLDLAKFALTFSVIAWLQRRRAVKFPLALT